MINKRNIFGILLILTVFFTAGFYSCKKKVDPNSPSPSNPLNQFHVQLPKLPLTNQYTSPNGVFIDTETPMPILRQDAIYRSVEKGLKKLIATTDGKGFMSYRNVQDFYVLMIRTSTRTSDFSGCQLIVTKGGQTIAGTVISLGSLVIEPPLILIPENYEKEDCDSQTTNATRFEGEHIEAWFNQREYFWQRTGLNDWHPMYADSTGNFAAEPKAADIHNHENNFGNETDKQTIINIVPYIRKR